MYWLVIIMGPFKKSCLLRYEGCACAGLTRPLPLILKQLPGIVNFLYYRMVIELDTECLYSLGLLSD